MSNLIPKMDWIYGNETPYRVCGVSVAVDTVHESNGITLVKCNYSTGAYVVSRAVPVHELYLPGAASDAAYIKKVEEAPNYIAKRIIANAMASVESIEDHLNALKFDLAELKSKFEAKPNV